MFLLAIIGFINFNNFESMIIEHKLNPYPRRMWVVKDENFDDIKKDFKLSPEDEELTNDEIEEDCNAMVFECIKDGYHGFMVFIASNCEKGTLVHEAIHVAFHVYEDCAMKLEPGMDQEPFCYLAEYIYKLLEQDVVQTK